MIPARPDTGPPVGSTPDPTTGGWVERAADTITGIPNQPWFPYAAAAVFAVLLVLSIRSRRKRAKTHDMAAITRTDRAITRITGLVATAVLSLGMWDFFGDVFDMHPLVRVTLFAFIEMQIIQAWRRTRRHLHRHGNLGNGIRTIYGLAFASATIAAVHADTVDVFLFRLFVAAVAAYMIAEELAEELDIWRAANPHRFTPTARKAANRRINWSLTPERVLVWLRLAEPAAREVGQVDRDRRIASFARTAFRLHLLKETAARQWRVRMALRSLRRQAEAANEHLSLATDRAAMDRVRAHLAFLYQVEQGTSRAAVADLSPFRQAPQLAIGATPFVSPPVRHDGTPLTATDDATEDATGTDNQTANAADIPPVTSADTVAPSNVPAKPANRAAKTLAGGAHVTAPDGARKLAKVVAKYPDAKLADLAKRTGMSERTVSRHLATARAIATASQGDEDDAKERLHMTPFVLPRQPVTAGVNGHHHTPKEPTR